jgi:hypothetical protein
MYIDTGFKGTYSTGVQAGADSATVDNGLTTPKADGASAGRDEMRRTLANGAADGANVTSTAAAALDVLGRFAYFFGTGRSAGGPASSPGQPAQAGTLADQEVNAQAGKPLGGGEVGAANSAVVGTRGQKKDEDVVVVE